MIGRILAVDPGEKRHGLAISDPTATIARPLAVLKHTSRVVDVAAIAQAAAENNVVRIIIGQPLDSDGKPGPSARRSARLAEALAAHINIPVELWDESGSTKMAKSARIALGVSRKKRKGHLDSLAAAVILQSYLDAQVI